jgi:tellurite resistance protein TehA-like permease
MGTAPSTFRILEKVACAMFLLLGCVITLCLQGCVIAQWVPMRNMVREQEC